MDKETIKRVNEAIARYYAGEMSVAEERRLSVFLKQNIDELPEDLMREAQLFSLINETVATESSMLQFAEECIDRIAQTEPMARGWSLPKRAFYWLGASAVAAVFMLVITLGKELPKENVATIQPIKTAQLSPKLAVTDTIASVEKEGDKHTKEITQKFITQSKPKNVSAVDEPIILSPNPPYTEVTDTAEAVRLIEYALMQVAKHREDASEMASEIEPLLMTNMKMANTLISNNI